MSEEKEEWGNIEIPNEEQKEVEFEIEEEEAKVEPKQKAEAKEEGKPPELDGIETKGAEKKNKTINKTKKRKR